MYTPTNPGYTTVMPIHHPGYTTVMPIHHPGMSPMLYTTRVCHPGYTPPGGYTSGCPYTTWVIPQDAHTPPGYMARYTPPGYMARYTPPGLHSSLHTLGIPASLPRTVLHGSLPCPARCPVRGAWAQPWRNPWVERLLRLLGLKSVTVGIPLRARLFRLPGEKERMIG